MTKAQINTQKSKRSLLNRITKAVYLSGSAVVSVMLGFLSKAEWRNFFENVPLPALGFALKFILLPVALAIDVAKVAIAGYALLTSKHKTFDQYAHLTIEAIKSILIGVAIFGVLGVIALTPPIGPALFISAIFLGSAYNLAASGGRYAASYQANKAKEPKVAAIHRLFGQKHAFNFALSAAIGIGFALILLSGVTGYPLLAIGIIAAVTAMVGGITSVIIAHRTQSRLASIPENKGKVITFSDILPRPSIRPQPSQTTTSGHRPSRKITTSSKPLKEAMAFFKRQPKMGSGKSHAQSLQHGLSLQKT